ncbi:CheR family methyltransferase [Mariprofundus erugo]|uniref:CheR family methyltransferase n=1 Tax=Mariprofundus erugo TaxID=2528639 RepID=UPI00138672FE|nr:CheR family methyltransferase [Mariprofundus erugo]
MSGTEDTLKRFSELICRQTGLHLYDKDMDKLLLTVRSRTDHGGFASEDAYYHYLMSGGHESEWETLMIRLTCGESHFFRDKGQLQLLQHRIIPELIERNAHKRSLKIWSAGCSTGEEPYTLAILIHELLQQRQGWRLTLIGSDINETSIHDAQKAIYRDWSFRGTGDEQIRTYFHSHRSGWQLDQKIRQMVSFIQVDLMNDRFPDVTSSLFGMDLIICRNVFIYYGQDAINTMMRKFAATLTDGGYLLTGHAEVANPEKSGLKLRSFAESTIFQRQAEHQEQEIVVRSGSAHLASPIKQPVTARPAAARPHHPASSWQRQLPAAHSASQKALLSLSELEKQLLRGEYRQVAGLLKTYLDQDPASIKANVMMARCMANTGDQVGAESLCRRLVRQHPLCADAYYILAQLAQERSNGDQARELLQKVIYLAPEFIAAHMDLAGIYQFAGESERAGREWAVALHLIGQLSDGTPIPFMEDVALSEVKSHLEQMAAGG